ncbi:arylesterase [Solidesulfovibrio sp.]
MPQPALALRLAALGDSLTAGWGLPLADAFPAQLARALAANGRNVEILNFGISGDTSAGGLARLDAVLAAAPDGVILELGANDMLRGMDPEIPRANLDAIMGRLHDAGIPILLCGMRAPRNFGRAYAEAYEALYVELARKYDAVLYPVFLDGVTGVPGLTKPDGLHPTAKGVAEIVRRFLPAAETFLARLGTPRAAP